MPLDQPHGIHRLQKLRRVPRGTLAQAGGNCLLQSLSGFCRYGGRLRGGVLHRDGHGGRGRSGDGILIAFDKGAQLLRPAGE